MNTIRSRHIRRLIVSRLLAALPLVLALAGCVSDVATSQPVRLTAAQVQEIQGTVTHNFYDPSSAQFRNLRAADITTTDGKTLRRVCGEVNGKNLDGGYVGFEMFGGTLQGSRFIQQDFFMPCEAS
jgi:hypothetical protein